MEKKEILIGIIGTENSHAAAFAERLNLEKQVPGFRVAALGGIDAEASRKIAESCGIDLICSAEEMAEKMDAVMVTARDGAYHAPFILPAVLKGKPVFVDKPFTRSSTEAKALIEAAERSGSIICGGSGLKYAPGVVQLAAELENGEYGVIKGGSITAPVSMQNEYGNFWFYSQHLVDMAGMVFGYDVQSVEAHITEEGAQASFYYADYTVKCRYIDHTKGGGAYRIEINGADKSTAEDIDASTIYDGEIAHFCEMIRTGKSPDSEEMLLAPVCIIEAILRSFESGSREQVIY